MHSKERESVFSSERLALVAIISSGDSTPERSPNWGAAEGGQRGTANNAGETGKIRTRSDHAEMRKWEIGEQG